MEPDKGASMIKPDIVKAYPSKCWSCGSRFGRRNKVERRKQQKARRLMTLAFLSTVTLVPLVIIGGLLPLFVLNKNIPGTVLWPYVFFLFAASIAPGTALAKRATRIPLLIHYKCSRCTADKWFVKAE